MRSGFLDTLTRIVMLVLAGMVSLSIIGAIAAMSEGGGGTRGFVVETRPQPVARESNEAQPARSEEQPPGGVGRGATVGKGTIAAAAGAAAAPSAENAKWLEVIAYVLFALAGLAALLALILWRLISELRRGADAAERLSDRGGVR